jgi:hypothetical protein
MAGCLLNYFLALLVSKRLRKTLTAISTFSSLVGVSTNENTQPVNVYWNTPTCDGALPLITKSQLTECISYLVIRKIHFS